MIALAPGYGVAWVTLDPDDDRPTADITLRPEQVIHGRLFDLQGQPVPNVTLVGLVGPPDCARASRPASVLASMVSTVRSQKSMTCRPGPSR